MPRFSYKVKDISGKTITDTADAYNRDALVERLQKQGYFIVNVAALSTDRNAPAQKRKVAKAKTEKKFTHKKIKMDDMLIFARQLATMMDAGVTLLRSLNVISDQITSEKFAATLKEVTGDVENGRSLSSSLAKHPKVFSQFWVSLVEVGEASGTMPLILEKLATYMEVQAEFRSTIISAIIYPAILFCVCIGAVAFFALFVGPRFEAIFTSMDAQLPTITIALLTTFKFIKEKFLLLIAAIVGGVFLLKKYTRTYHGRMQFEQFMFHLPTFGNIYRLIIVERFSSQMAILIDSGVPILFALEITEKLVENRTCSLIVNDIKESVREGRMLAEPMEESGFFPSMCIQMIKVGEETGELSKMLKHVSNYYQRNVSEFMKRLSTMIEPFMLVFMGGIIGVIVLAMFLPMFNMSQLG